MVFSVGTGYRLATLDRQEKIANFSLKLEKLAVGLYKPFIKTSEAFSAVYFNQWDLKSLNLDLVNKIAALALAVLCLPATVLSYAMAGVVDLTWSNFLNKKGYSVISYEKPQTEHRENRSILSLNTCMLFGCLPSFFGGVEPASKRIDSLKNLILEKKADVVFLQEVSRDASSMLIEKLKGEYTHFICSVSPQPFLLMDASLFIALKEKPISLKHVPLPTTSTMRRSCMIVELEDGYYLTTHLEAGSSIEDAIARKRQIEVINQEIEILQKASDKPIFLLGDFNLKNTFDEDSEYKKSGIETHLTNLDTAKELNEETATCTNHLTREKAGQQRTEPQEFELVDYAFILEKGQMFSTLGLQKIDTYPKTGTLNALSDHKALLVTFKRA